MRSKIFILLAMILVASQFAFAQRERNYIYLLDCTKSMSGYNGAPNIWAPTKNYLKTDIERQKKVKGTTVHVVPFQGSCLNVHSFLAEDFNWKSLEKELDGYQENITRTNICDAWDEGQKYINKNKDNYIILLTDGLDNCKGTAALAQKLEQFCGKYRHTQAFYVVLTKNAINPQIKEVVDRCPDAWIVDASKKINPFGGFDKNITIHANTRNLDKAHKLLFSTVGEFSASSECNDPCFSVSIEEGKIKDGSMSVKIAAKQSMQYIQANLPNPYKFTFDVKAKDVQIINPTITVEMTNDPERELEIISEEQDMGEAKWYDSFLFWGAKEPDTLSLDLKGAFNEEAKKCGSTVRLKIVDADGLKDFKLFFNGEEVTNGTILCDAPKMPESTILSIVYNPEAKQGKRYLIINAANEKNLDNINGAPVEDFEVSVRSECDVDWNPLKTFLFWLGVIILALLVIWFLFLKRIFFPTFTIGTVMVTSPYYSMIKIKGARRIVFSDKKVKQSPINRFFTGKVLCSVNPCWTQPLVMEPAKKAIRVIPNTTYIFNPFAARLTSPSQYTIENTAAKNTIKLTVN